MSGINATAVCTARTPRVSVVAFHGTGDPIVPYQGGAYFSGEPIGRVLGVADAKPVDDAAAAWAAFDGCGTPAAKSDVAADVQRFVWPDCPPNGDGAALPGRRWWPHLAGCHCGGRGRLGPTTTSIDATKRILDFFASHPRR